MAISKYYNGSISFVDVMDMPIWMYQCIIGIMNEGIMKQNKKEQKQEAEGILKEMRKHNG